ncbi:hypothetical protein HGRIS_008882 [Hohenbuehelia grisea]|uniref:Uncharacterized protein n=1 Tax=Hohenbuehelia grisea TaxID=104357 RepID=A0ABR3IZK3_9AGAR
MRCTSFTRAFTLFVASAMFSGVLAQASYNETGIVLDTRAPEVDMTTYTPDLDARGLNDAGEPLHVEWERGEYGVGEYISAPSEAPEHRLEARNPAAVIRVAAQVLKKAFRAISDGIKADKDMRSKYTFALISELRKKHPQFNYVVCHTKHRTRFDDVRGVDWDHRHEEVDIKIGGTIGYEIYNFRSGEFWREGDGGYLNWAYAGNILSKSDDGKHLVFGPPTAAVDPKPAPKKKDEDEC